MVGTVSSKTESDSLQRNEAWLQKRSGCFTGSKLSLLMGCGKATSKIPWGDTAKLFDFSVTAEKYIYNVGKERLTGLRSQQQSSKQMQHGTDHEPLLIQQLLDDGVITDFEELGFEYFGDYHNGGASADGRAIYKGVLVGCEIKCCVSWDGHYKRMYEAVHDKHDDFWQHQGEMLAMGVDSLLYVVAMPMQVEKYDTQIVAASVTHQEALMHRCRIADMAIKLWSKYTYKEALQIACNNYKELINN